MNIVVELEGILRDSRTDIPIAQGVQTAGALSAYNQVTVITDLTGKQAEQWLSQNKVVDYDHVVDSSVKLEGTDLKEHQLNLTRSKGRVDLVLTSNPSLWVFCFEKGIPVILFAVPDYTDVPNRPDAPKGLRRWDEIEATIRRQNEIRAKEVRDKTRTDFRVE